MYYRLILQTGQIVGNIIVVFRAIPPNQWGLRYQINTVYEVFIINLCLSHIIFAVTRATICHCRFLPELSCIVFEDFDELQLQNREIWDHICYYAEQNGEESVPEGLIFASTSANIEDEVYHNLHDEGNSPEHKYDRNVLGILVFLI